LTRAEILTGGTAIRLVVLTKARHAILGSIKIKIATVQTAVTTAKETATVSEAAS
jgi:hypothetical protein